jgi:NADPH:quinone reductase-like Zn-dependent oxidoreductase
MRAAGVRHLGDVVEVLDLPDPRGLRAGEILLEVRAAGVGNWDEFVRTGSWDTGPRPPMALGVAAAGHVAAAGSPAAGTGAGGFGTGGFGTGDRVTTHSVPLPEQGCWAEWSRPT